MEDQDDLGAQEVDREIDGRMYRIRPMPFGAGRKALMRLVKIASPILSAAFQEGQAGDKMSMIARALDKLPSALDDTDVEYFAKEFGNCSWYQEGDKWVPLLPAKQERHFAGRYLAFAQWLAESIKHNFGSFFSSVMSVNAAGLMTEKAATKAPR